MSDNLVNLTDADLFRIHDSARQQERRIAAEIDRRRRDWMTAQHLWGASTDMFRRAVERNAA